MKHLSIHRAARFYFMISLIVLPAVMQAQDRITFKCKELGLDVSESLRCDPVSEDDPACLPEAYSTLAAYFPATSKAPGKRIEVHFPARPGTYHWTQKSNDDRNDSLDFNFVYDPQPEEYGHELTAYAKDLTIVITRYDAAKNGIVEGRFSGVLESFVSATHQTVHFSIEGSFHTTRSGRGSECRKLRHSEKNLMDRLDSIFNDAVKPVLPAQGWTIQSESSATQAAGSPAPYRPLMLCSNYTLTLAPDPESELARTINDSAAFYRQKSSEGTAGEQMAAIKAMFDWIARQHVTIEMDVNDPFLNSPVSGSVKILPLPGVPLAYRLYGAGATDMEQLEESIILLFGNWNGAKPGVIDRYVDYPFLHRTPGPYVENIYIRFEGPFAVTEKLVRSINWAALNKW